jgi:hypothetical protein
MNLSSILVGQSGPASSRNSAGKPQRPTAAIGGRFPPDPFLRGALPEVGLGQSCRFAPILSASAQGQCSEQITAERPGHFCIEILLDDSAQGLVQLADGT